MSDHAIPTLLRKRKEIAAIIDQKQAELVNLLSDLNALDCATRIFKLTLNSPKSSCARCRHETAQGAARCQPSAGDPPHGFGADADRGYQG